MVDPSSPSLAPPAPAYPFALGGMDPLRRAQTLTRLREVHQQYRYQIDVVNARVTVANAARETSMSTPGGRSRLMASFPPAVDEEELLDALRREATHVAQMIAQLAAPTHPGWDANVGVAGGAEGVYAYGGLRAPPGGQGGGGNGGDRTGGAVHPAVATALEVADRQAKNKILHSIFGKRKRGSAASPTMSAGGGDGGGGVGGGSPGGSANKRATKAAIAVASAAAAMHATPPRATASANGFALVAPLAATYDPRKARELRQRALYAAMFHGTGEELAKTIQPHVVPAAVYLNGGRNVVQGYPTAAN
jgi:hypothetical protein